jgi:tetratricopeptide (TPR) repeat protein
MTNAYREFSALMKRRAFNEAADFASRRLQEAGERSEFWYTQLSSALREEGRYDEALKAADKACALAPKNGWAHVARGDALLKKKDVKGAVQSFEEAIGDSRASSRALKGLLACLARSESWERMLSVLAQYSFPAGETISWRVKALLALGRNGEAQQVCDDLLATEPDNPAALWKKAELQVAAEGVDPVRQRYSRLCRIPGKPAVYSEIHAWLCKQSGDVAGALAQYEKLSQSAADPSVLRRQAFALAKTGQEERAAALMEELLRMSPDDLYLHAAYLPVCTRLDNMERAWRFYHELLALHPQSKGIYGRLKRVRTAMEKKSRERQV